MKLILERTRLLACSVVTCLGISALLNSPALAQVNGPGYPVNGPGPSPSSEFDIVFNIPGDEDILTGFNDQPLPGGFEFDPTTTQVNVSDGAQLREGFNVCGFQELNMTGGSFDRNFLVCSVGEVNLSGGTVGSSFRALAGSDVQITGGEFRRNGVDLNGTFGLSNFEVFTGTLADGSSFIFSRESGNPNSDSIFSVVLTTTDLPPIDTNPFVIDSPIVSGPSGLRAGQEATLVEGGSLGINYAVVDATFNVEGGVLGKGAETYNSEVNISDGSVGDFFSAHLGSVVNISGGTIGNVFAARLGSEVNISGGTFGDSFQARFVSTVNIQGSEFSIDGTPLNNLQPGQPFTITDRDVTLSGVLADGEPFSFDLNSEDTSSINDFEEFFSPDAILSVVLTEPVLLGDSNLDGTVNFLDISPFIDILSANSFLAQADTNQDGVVDFMDIQSFIEILAGTGT